ncbi:MAG: protein translocase subunit SecD [Bacteroidales bacterium]
MQTKGLIRVIAVALVLICVFYLSFSFVTSSVTKDANAYAQSMAETADESNDTFKNYYNAYIDSIAKEKVYLNYYTFQQVREMEVGLGLDLKGGMNVTLQISVPDILRSLSNDNPDANFNRAIFLADSLHRNEADFVASFITEYNKLAPEGNLAQIFRNIERVNTTSSNSEVASILKDEVTQMVDNSTNVLRTRIDRFGVVSPNIQKLEREGQILLELPGVKEPERVRKLLQGSANLEFYETYQANEISQQLQALSAAAAKTAAAQSDSAAMSKYKSLEKLLWGVGGIGGPVAGTTATIDTAAVNAILNSADAKRILPNNLKLAWGVKSTDETGKYYQLIALKTIAGKPALGGDVVKDASSNFDNMQGNIVSMSMNNDGARAWARITQNNLDKQVAIVLDDQVYSFPTVNSVIEGGRSQITGDFSIEEAKDLANVLKSGKMAANVSIIGESVIGPSLGQQAISNGLISFLVALVLLMIFMVLIYGVGPGMIANLGLVFNLFFTMGILASIQAVLTLSGIAGIVLALGMAVDANVLIFERAKEELRAGKNLKAAVADGYSNAFSAIFDSNLTSIITGIILLIYGTGPIKGFATTLMIGIICSFFTSVFLTRLILEGLINKGTFKNITFTTKLTANLFQNFKNNFISQRKMMFSIVAAILVIVSISFGVRGLSQGIDFSGGRNYIVQFDHAVETHELQDKLAPSFVDASISVITIDNATKVRISTNYKIDSDNASVDDEIMGMLYAGLKDELKGMSYEDFSVSNEEIGVLSTAKVGPSIAADITRGAIWAVALSLLAMALYILLRFRNISYSVGALAAVAFTAYTIIGLYSLFYGILPFPMEIDQQFIAAILTVIGYQVNDTVVVFDRVRETRTLNPKGDTLTVFNSALNSTIARTIMTSVSTLLVLICIFALGGETIRSFVFAMALGVIIGTFASLYIASPVAYLIQNKLAKK